MGERFLELFKAPVLALFSMAFYLRVLFTKTGTGFSYLVFLAMLLAVPVTYKVDSLAQIMRGYELSRLVAQVPPSYISPEGLLTSKTDINYAEIRNSRGDVVIVYNPDDYMLQTQLLEVPVEITSRSLIFRLRNENGTVQKAQSIPWSVIFERGGNFEPMQAAASFEQACNAPLAAFYVGSTAYLFFYVFLNWILIAVLGKLMLFYMTSVRLRLRECLRLSACANTVVMLMGTVNFFMPVSVNLTILFIIPVIYLIVIGRYLRRTASAYGIEALSLGIRLACRRDGLKTLPLASDYEKAVTMIAASRSGTTHDESSTDAAADGAADKKPGPDDNLQRGTKGKDQGQGSGPGIFMP